MYPGYHRIDNDLQKLAHCFIKLGISVNIYPNDVNATMASTLGHKCGFKVNINCGYLSGFLY